MDELQAMSAKLEAPELLWHDDLKNHRRLAGAGVKTRLPEAATSDSRSPGASSMDRSSAQDRALRALAPPAEG
jgi:hypothetical protein